MKVYDSLRRAGLVGSVLSAIALASAGELSVAIGLLAAAFSSLPNGEKND